MSWSTRVQLEQLSESLRHCQSPHSDTSVHGVLSVESGRRITVLTRRTAVTCWGMGQQGEFFGVELVRHQASVRDLIHSLALAPP